MSNVPKGYSVLRILPCSDKNDFPDIAALYLEEAGKKLQALPPAQGSWPKARKHRVYPAPIPRKQELTWNHLQL